MTSRASFTAITISLILASVPGCFESARAQTPSPAPAPGPSSAAAATAPAPAAAATPSSAPGAQKPAAKLPVDGGGTSADEAAAKHAKRTACLKSSKEKKLVGAQKNAFVKECTAAP